jgi:hypothetical protein
MSELIACALEHWLFSTAVQGHLYGKRIPFYIRGIRGSGDGSMDIYEGKTARTVSPAEWKSLQDGEVMVSVVKGIRPVRISIHPKFLVPWEPKGGNDVVVIDGPWFGIAGAIVGRENESYAVRFTLAEDSRDECFEGKQLANLEPFRR